MLTLIQKLFGKRLSTTRADPHSDVSSAQTAPAPHPEITSAPTASTNSLFKRGFGAPTAIASESAPSNKSLFNERFGSSSVPMVTSPTSYIENSTTEQSLPADEARDSLWPQRQEQSKSVSVVAPAISTESILPAFVAIDCETTGLSPDQGDRIVSFAAIEFAEMRISGDMTARSKYLVFNPERPCHWAARKAHGLTDRFLSFQPLFSAHANEIAEMIHNKLVVGHNLSFDMKFLRSEFTHCGIRDWEPSHMSCTMQMFANVLPGRRKSLDSVCIDLGVDLSVRGEHHSAIVDAALAAQVFAKLKGNVKMSVTTSIVRDFSNLREVPPPKRSRSKRRLDDA